MSEIRELCDKIDDEVADLRQKAGAKAWGDFSRRAFIYNLVNIIPGLEELDELFGDIQKKASETGEGDKIGVNNHLKEIGSFTAVLKRNKAMEESRIEKMKLQGTEHFADTITVPELYSDLEQKTLGILLKSNYMIERIRIRDRKKSPEMNTKAAQRNVLDILEKKETELAELREKYNETRKNSFLGLVERDSSIEIEQELNELSRNLGAKTALMKKNFEIVKDESDQYQQQLNELEDRIGNVEELEAQLTGKTFELITMLKKERDYVKKVLIEIEQDTIQLRNTYSKELLGLQEEKMNLKNSLDDKYEKQIRELKKDLKDKGELVKHFQDTVSDKEARLIDLEEKNDKLRLINKNLEKHGKVKEHFSQKEKKPKKKTRTRKKKS